MSIFYKKDELMSEIFYFDCNRKNTSQIRSLVKKRNLKICYKRNREKILKNTDFIIRYNKKYILLYILSESESLRKDVLNGFS